jgi:SAM-dependent methyltransferase
VQAESITTHPLWRAGLDRELGWWREFLRARALADPEYRARFDPLAPLQPHLAALLPAGRRPADLRLLDCAAGPATSLGKTLDGMRLDVVAVDVLAAEYGAILAELGLVPPVPTLPGEVERLDALLPAGVFDLVFMRYALDHCHSPLVALQQMLRVARPRAPVVIEHYRDEHDTRYEGLKRWTLEPHDRDLVVFNDRQRFAVSSALPGAGVTCTFGAHWMVAVIRAMDR